MHTHTHSRFYACKINMVKINTHSSVDLTQEFSPVWNQTGAFKLQDKSFFSPFFKYISNGIVQNGLESQLRCYTYHKSPDAR